MELPRQNDDPPARRFVGLFHVLLVGFAIPARWPGLVVYALAAVLAAALSWVWAVRSGAAERGLLVFLLIIAFFAYDRLLLGSLSRRRVSFASWRAQFFALALPRVAAALALGLALPWLGWPVALALLVAVQALGALALYRGAIIEPRELSLTRLDISSDRLRPGSAALRILHVSDLHIERLGARESQLLELVESAAPDFILITGDYVNLSNQHDPQTHQDVRAIMSQLSAPGGVYAVLGSPAVDLREVVVPLFEGLAVRLLRDEVVSATMPDGRAVQLIGLECRHDIAADTDVLDGLLANVAGDAPLVLLYHSPELMPQAAERGIDLYLCGHTHGGQVRLPLVGALFSSSKLGRRYVMGHYHEGRTHLYVSRGVGFEGLGAPRVRFLCPPEITLTTIAPAGAGEEIDGEQRSRGEEISVQYSVSSLNTEH